VFFFFFFFFLTEEKGLCMCGVVFFFVFFFFLGGGGVCIILFEIPKKWRSYFKLQWEVSVVRSWTFSGTTLVILDCHSGECPIIIQNYSKWLITTSSLLYMIITL